mgnify:CR=1 FL=1
MRKLLFLVCLTCVLSACAPKTDQTSVTDTTSSTDASAETSNAGTVSFTDDLGRKVTVTSPERVTAMIGSFADIWCLAGGREQLVAAAHDSWTSFDLGLDNTVADLGSIKEPNLEILLSSQPDLILASCNTASNIELLKTFENAGITTAYFDIQNFDDYLRMLDICTQITGRQDCFEQYGQSIKGQIQLAIDRQDHSSPTVLCIRITGSSAKIKGSSDNVLGEMLADLGCVNIADSNNTLLENLSLETVMKADPDYIFAVLQGSDPANAQKTLEQTLLSHPAWNSLRAVQEKRFYILEHELYNLKPNARWGEAYEKLADILYSKPKP